jgi:tRNA A58 N-methylase Trm61
MTDVDLDFLAEHVQRLRPSSVLEFGCGASTVRMARVLADVHGDDRVRVFSVEQDAAFAEECRHRLVAEGLSATVVHRVLVAQAAPDGETQSYDLSGDFLATLLQQDSPDLIVVDGPSGGSFARFPVLPNVRACLAAETRFLLHDGLRDHELLLVAKAWRGVPGIRVEGVYVDGEGFLTGTVAP